MRKIFITLLLLATISLSVNSEVDYVQTTMDEHRYEMVQLVYGAYAYSIKLINGPETFGYTQRTVPLSL